MLSISERGYFFNEPAGERLCVQASVPEELARVPSMSPSTSQAEWLFKKVYLPQTRVRVSIKRHEHTMQNNLFVIALKIK